MKKFKLIIAAFLLFLFVGTAFAEEDFNLWVKDYENRNTTHTVTVDTVGSGFECRANVTVGGALVHKSLWKMSKWDACFDLRTWSLGGDTTLLPEVTTAQRDALGTILDGRPIWNSTLNRMEICEAGTFTPSSGAISTSNTFGSMYENRATGSIIGSGDGTNTAWITATKGAFTNESNFSFNKDATNGDNIKILVAGTYEMAFSASFTAINNTATITGAIYINGIESIIKHSRIGHNSRPRLLVSLGTLTLAINDLVTWHAVSSTSTQAIKVYQIHVDIE